MSRSSIEILAHQDTPLGALCLRRRTVPGRPGVVVTEITLDHEMLMSSHVTTSEERLARRALELHSGSGLDVLVGGLGLGFTAHAVLASDRVARCEVVEYVSAVIDWTQRGLTPLGAALRADTRFVMTHGDVYALLDAAPARRHDVILVDVDHSPSERLGEDSASFYSEQGLQRARRHLAPGGVLGVWSYAEDSPFADAMRAVFDEVHVEPVRIVHDLVDEEHTDWLFFARADGDGDATHAVRPLPHPPHP
jgi:spermidine synthase